MLISSYGFLFQASLLPRRLQSFSFQSAAGQLTGSNAIRYHNQWQLMNLCFVKKPRNRPIMLKCERIVYWILMHHLPTTNILLKCYSNVTLSIFVCCCCWYCWCCWCCVTDEFIWQFFFFNSPSSWISWKTCYFCWLSFFFWLQRRLECRNQTRYPFIIIIYLINSYIYIKMVVVGGGSDVGFHSSLCSLFHYRRWWPMLQSAQSCIH